MENIDKLKEIMDAYAMEKHTEIMRAKYRANMKKYRETHRDQHNEYINNKTKEYYQKNKEKCNQKRAELYRKKRAEALLNGVQPKKRGPKPCILVEVPKTNV